MQQWTNFLLPGTFALPLKCQTQSTGGALGSGKISGQNSEAMKFLKKPSKVSKVSSFRIIFAVLMEGF